MSQVEQLATKNSTPRNEAQPPRNRTWEPLRVPGASERNSAPMAKVMRKEAWHTLRRDQASGNPLFPSIQPQNQSLFYALTYTSDFTGGSPP